MAEKLAWARENDVIPPESATRTVSVACNESEPDCPHCASKPKKKSCCESGIQTKSATPCCEKTAPKSEKRSFQIVIGIFAQKCKGQAVAGFGLLPVCVEPPMPFVVVVETAMSERVALIDHVPTARATPPDAPPPRS
jgi:hypothetical protein